MRGKVSAAWSAYHDLTQLQQSSLLQEKMCQAFAWKRDDPFSVRALLRWQLDQMARDNRKRVKNYAKALDWYFIKDKSIEEYADFANLKTVRGAEKRIESACKFSARELNEKLHQDSISPQHYPIIVRYETLDQTQKQCVQYLALFEKPEPITFLSNVALPPVQTALPDLLEVGLLVQSDNRVRVHPQAYAWLHRQIIASQRRRWHAKIAKLYLATDPLSAVYHCQQAGNWQQAAKLLIAQSEHLAQSETLEVWDKRVAAMQLKGLPKETRTQLTLIQGQIAQLRGDATTALSAYEQAQMLADKASRFSFEAIFRTAHLLQEQDVNRAMYLLGQLLELAEDKSEHWRTRGVLLLAWLQIEHRENFAEGKRLLEQEIDAGQLDSADLRFDHANTWREYYRRTLTDADHEAYLHYAYEAYRFSLDSADTIKRLKAQYNLGRAYENCAKYEQACRVLAQNYAEAKAANLAWLVAQNRNVMANALVNGSKKFAEAVPLYNEALDYFRQTNNERSVGSPLIGLVYAHAELGNVALARPLLEEGLALAQRLNHKGLKRMLSWHKNHYPELTHDLSDNQINALRYIRSNDKITNRAYRKLNGVGSNKTARKQLHEMVVLEILQEQGKGSATYYCRAE